MLLDREHRPLRGAAGYLRALRGGAARRGGLLLLDPAQGDPRHGRLLPGLLRPAEAQAQGGAGELPQLAQGTPDRSARDGGGEGTPSVDHFHISLWRVFVCC